MDLKRFFITAGLIVVIILAFVFGKNLLPSSSSYKTSASSTNFESKSVTVNKTFKFPLADREGKKAGEFEFTIETADLKNEVVIKGVKATAVQGRAFIVVNLKLVNDSKQGIQVNTRNYVRLIVNKNEEELLAADLHNDPVEVQAISTKYTRLGFGINETDKDFVLLVGEIEGEKERIPLSFK